MLTAAYHRLRKNYPALKLEFLAPKWTVTATFYGYLYDHNVSTHNYPMTYVLASAKSDATGHRWLAASAVLALIISRF